MNDFTKKTDKKSYRSGGDVIPNPKLEK